MSLAAVLVTVTRYLTGNSLKEELSFALLRAEDVWWERGSVSGSSASISLGAKQLIILDLHDEGNWGGALLRQC